MLKLSNNLLLPPVLLTNYISFLRVYRTDLGIMGHSNSGTEGWQNNTLVVLVDKSNL